METNTTLNSYITTRNSTFNRFALRLYLENLKQDAFEQDETPLEIFKYISDKMIEHGGKFFSFVNEFEAYLDEQHLTIPEQLLLFSIVKDYLREMSSKVSNTHYEYYYEDYLSYFKALEQVNISENTETIIAATDIPTMLSDIIHRQVVKLSEDLDTIPVAQKAKVITSLIKTLPTGNKIKKDTTGNTIPLPPSLLETGTDFTSR